VLVDDGSTDNTLARVQRGDRVRVIIFEKNSGQSAAMHAGITALGDVIVTLDGDLQNDPADIPAMITKLESRLGPRLRLPPKRKDTPFKRLQSRSPTPCAPVSSATACATPAAR
jgi:dolichol-phosphate mannosyltransferase